ncbi:hypothetical protein [Nonomuraea sp. NPDC046570]|uniref:hypothetical protein n=1 Tax=Nonomuraea sp. NPDC046570 TaxID=3155255 RepID=UPI003404A166
MKPMTSRPLSQPPLAQHVEPETFEFPLDRVELLVLFRRDHSLLAQEADQPPQRPDGLPPPPASARRTWANRSTCRVVSPAAASPSDSSQRLRCAITYA